MDLNILKPDCDLRFKFQIINLLKERLAYIHDMGILKSNHIKKIELMYKTKYSAKIYLKDNLKDEKNIIIMQLLLGSDYMKETNTIVNHFMLNMQYSNRMFNIKRYPNKKIRVARLYDVTNLVLNHVSNKNRKKNYN